MTIWNQRPSRASGLGGDMPSKRYRAILEFFLCNEEEDEEEEEARLAWVAWLGKSGRLGAIETYARDIPFEGGMRVSLGAIASSIESLATAGFDLDQIETSWMDGAVTHELVFPDCLVVLER